MNFIEEYNYTKLEAAWGPARPEAFVAEEPAKMLFLDGSVYQIRDLFASVLSHMQYNNQVPSAPEGERLPRSRFPLIVGNEAGAVLGLMIAMGYTPEEILTRWVDDVFNVDDLLFGKRTLHRALSFLHPRPSGALHKGERLRAKIDELLVGRYDLDEGVRMTLDQFCRATRVNFQVNAFSTSHDVGRIITRENYPDMPVSEAVMASLARFPVLRMRTWCGETFMSRSRMNPVPLTEMRTEYNKLKTEVMPPFEVGVRIFTQRMMRLVGKDDEFMLMWSRAEFDKKTTLSVIGSRTTVTGSSHAVEDW